MFSLPRLGAVSFYSLVVCFSAYSSLTAAQPQSALAAHQHGVSQLNIVLEQEQLHLAWQTPAMDVLGFEYLAKTTAEQQQVQQLKQTLQQLENLVTLPAGAQCALQQVELQGAQLSAHTLHDHDHDHAEISWHAQLSCAVPKQLTQLSFAPLFAHFPSMQQVQVQLLTSAEQQAATLTAKQSQLQLMP
ncbi:ZrgA family zinc uptake protein [Thiopseudomonas alkaliphila]|uniref:ZrgA family zinc uptake protein n=1 Tax=Thiopseudomonas alkaliphila TaxID=1697053 RepID=UPI00069F70A3|nr:DUF2796 domain-containing protein [Thiopseudomonas alkaliphila]